MRQGQYLVPSTVEFSDVLACSFHDIKNSLELLSCTFDSLITEIAETQKNREQLSCLQYEIKRINNTICYLLAIYRDGLSKYALDIEYLSVFEYIHRLTSSFCEFAQVKGVEVETECANDIFCSFDDYLISLVLEEIVNNALRYTQDKLRISAYNDDHYLWIMIEDNGPGYPEALLAEDFFDKVPSCGLGSRTGLGIYFADIIAKSHSHNERQGFIKIDNNSRLGGGRFILALP